MDAGYLREKAREFVELASLASEENVRRRLLKLAQEFEDLADRIEEGE